MSLEPVREALLADARGDCDELRAAAESAATAAVEAAHQEAEKMFAAAREEGRVEAMAAAAAERARSRRRSREMVLAARRDARHQLQVEARRAASQLRDAPGYDALLDGLARVARCQLGDDVVLTVDDEVGGLVARAGSRSVDYRLPVIADRCMAALGAEVATLWR